MFLAAVYFVPRIVISPDGAFNENWTDSSVFRAWVICASDHAKAQVMEKAILCSFEVAILGPA